MSKKTTYITNITPLPSSITREDAISQLHDHHAMIELNPLVKKYETTDPPPNASDDEAERAIWYEITDIINYLPGGVIKGEVSYKACFYNLPLGLQTHVFAPAGVDIRSKWSVGGNQPGEPKETREMGSKTPNEGLYVKEDVELRCSFIMSAFVAKNLKKSHLVVADQIVARANTMKSRSSPSLKRHSASRSVEDVLNWQPYTITQQTSFHSESSIPRQLHPRAVPLLPRCVCERTPHQPTCPFFNTGGATHERRRSLPFNAISSPSASSQYSQATFSASSPQQDRRPSELHGSAGSNSCLCTGGLHEHGCMLYPGLRLMLSPTSSPSRTLPFSNTFPLSSSEEPPPIPPRAQGRPAQLFAAQRPGEQAELGAIRSPVDGLSNEPGVRAAGDGIQGSNAMADRPETVRFPRSNRILR